jgi:catechol 2,3-dioxygenase-like lactoylglutathione lyase family enzyme
MATLQDSARATMITGMDLAGCTVADVQRSIAFYRDVLGMTPVEASSGGAYFPLADGTWFGLYKPDNFEKASFGIMFAVPDAKSAVELYRSRGAKISDPFESPVCIMAFGEDPDGNGFVIHQRTNHDDPPLPPHTRTSTSINGIDLACYLVSDPKRSLGFYRDVLGMTPTEIDELGRGAEFTLEDGSSFGFWRPEEIPEGTPLSGGGPMFAVTDAAAGAAKLRERGVEVDGPEESPNCYMYFSKDPDGIMVVLHQRKS